MAPLFQKPPNCHFPSLSPTIEGDGGQQRKKMKIWDICAKNENLGHLCWKSKSGTSVLKWREITIFLHFGATIEEVLVICSLSPAQREAIFFLLLSCCAYTSDTAKNWQEHTVGKRWDGLCYFP